MDKKIGDDFARDMLKRGLDELRELGHFSGGNVAQPNTHTADHEQPAAEPEKSPNRSPEIERDR